MKPKNNFFAAGAKMKATQKSVEIPPKGTVKTVSFKNIFEEIKNAKTLKISVEGHKIVQDKNGTLWRVSNGGNRIMKYKKTNGLEKGN